jgi:hypothetical protein
VQAIAGRGAVVKFYREEAMNDAAAVRGGGASSMGGKGRGRQTWRTLSRRRHGPEQRDAIERRAVECVLCSIVLKELKKR